MASDWTAACHLPIIDHVWKCMLTNIDVNTLRLRQNDWHFQMHFFCNENEWIWIKISLKFVSKGPIKNNLALVQIMVNLF